MYVNLKPASKGENVECHILWLRNDLTSKYQQRVSELQVMKSWPKCEIISYQISEFIYNYRIYSKERRGALLFWGFQMRRLIGGGALSGEVLFKKSLIVTEHF